MQKLHVSRTNLSETHPLPPGLRDELRTLGVIRYRHNSKNIYESLMKSLRATTNKSADNPTIKETSCVLAALFELRAISDFL